MLFRKKSTVTAKQSFPKYTLLDTLVITGNQKDYEIFREAAPRLFDITHTDVSLSFDYEKESATGLAHIDIQPYGYPHPDTIYLDAKNMEILAVNWSLSNLQTRSATSFLTPCPFSTEASLYLIPPPEAWQNVPSTERLYEIPLRSKDA